VDRLINQVVHWQAGRWAAGLRNDPPVSTGDPGPVASRGDRVYALVQRLADRVADAEGRPHLTVPRLSDLVLPDQTRVMANDLLDCAAPDRVMDQATEDVDAVRRTL
jgi:hypothetical protein